MMKLMKKGIIVLLALSLITALFAGCKSDDEETGSGAATDSNSNSSTDASGNTDSGNGDNYLGDITFTYWSADTTAGQNDDDYQSPVSQEILAQTGVTIDKEFAVGDPSEKLSFMAAAGEYPDFIYALEYSNIIVDAGGFLRLNELIDEHGPNIKALYGDDLGRLQYSGEDDSIYMLGLPTVDEIKFRPESGFQVQHAVLEELGYPEMETLADLEAVIEAYMEMYPEINGQPTLGLSLLADSWRIKISTTNPAVLATGGANDGEWYYEDGEAILHLTRPEEREYFRWLNGLNAKGLLDPESFIQKYDQYQAKISEGRVLALADSLWEYAEAQQSLVASGMPERTYGMFPLVLEEGMKYAEFRPTGYSGGYGVGISTSCEDPVAAIKFLDWMCTEEAQILFRWGLEGVHFEEVDGVRQFLPDVFERWTDDPNFSKDEGVGIYSWPWPGYGQGAVDSEGMFYSPIHTQTIIDGYNEPEAATLEAYGVELWRDLYPDESNFEKSKYGVLWQINIPSEMDAAVIFARYDEIVARKIPEAILADPADFDRIFDEFLAELEAINIDLLEEQFNELIDQRIESWTY